MFVTLLIPAGLKGCQPSPPSNLEASEHPIRVPATVSGALEAISAVLYAADNLKVEMKRGCLESVALLARRAYLSGKVYIPCLLTQLYC